jgi:hypothetical protein
MHSPADDTEIRRLRHDVRGALNELRLTVEALGGETDPAAALEWLDLIERAADRCDALMQRLTDAGG